MPSSQEINYATLHAPRILCLHGGGTNAEILRLQARAYIPRLSPHFRLVFANAPFFCAPHAAIVPVYEDFGPFRLWSRWRADQELGEEVPNKAWERQMREAMAEDDTLGATGEWIGLLGFSQGARVAGSVLFESQLRMEKSDPGWSFGAKAPVPVPEGFAGGRWQFGVLMAGRGPWVALSEEGEKIEGLESGGALISVGELRKEAGEGKLRLPTVHVHGLKDDGLEFMRQMRAFDCEVDSARLVEWNGDHRLAFKSVDVDPVAKEIFKIGVQLGILDISDPNEA